MRKFDELPDKIKPHLKSILASSGMPQTEDSLEKLASQWLEKRQQFSAITSELQMEESSVFFMEDPRGAVLLTYSGSLVTIGTLCAGSRWVEYTSLKLREDVPSVIKSEKVNLTADIHLQNCALLEPGLLRKTSEILAIACCGEDLKPVEQEKQLKRATSALTDSFVRIHNA